MCRWRSEAPSIPYLGRKTASRSPATRVTADGSFWKRLDVSIAKKVSSGATSTNSHPSSRPKSHQLLVRLRSGVIAPDDDAHVVIIPEAVLVNRARETCARAPVSRCYH